MKRIAARFMLAPLLVCALVAVACAPAFAASAKRAAQPTIQKSHPVQAVAHGAGRRVH